MVVDVKCVKGEGETTVEMQFMPDIHLTCESCLGKRFKDEVLEVRYFEKSITDILDMSVDQAVAFFELHARTAAEKKIIAKLTPLQEVGLGYVALGQSSNTLSGGEAQRIKLASFIGKDKQVKMVASSFCLMSLPQACTRMIFETS